MIRVLLALVVVSGLIGDGARPALAAAGDLDPTFGNGGKVTANLPGWDVAAALVIQPDGKVVAAGTSNLFLGNFVLARYLPNGTLDPTFGNGGMVTTDFGNNDFAYALVLQPDGKLVAAGQASSKFGLARYQPNGTLDPTFGSGGKVLTDFEDDPTFIGADIAYALVLQPDGKLVAAGGSPPGNFVLARYLPNGTLDPTFGSGGMVTTNFGSRASFAGAGALVLQPDSKLVAAGINGEFFPGSFALVRYQANGTLDPTFGSGGMVTTDFGGEDRIAALVLQPDGKLVAAGSSNRLAGNFVLARYLTNGALDPTFGSGGTVTTDFGGQEDKAGTALVLQPDGKLVAAGYGGPSSSNFALARYLTNGTLDPTFGNGGMVTTDFGGNDAAFALVLQPDGKLVAAGASVTSTSSAIALARYDSAGVSIGGKGLGITPRTSIDLSWTGGTQQVSYLIARSPEASAVLSNRDAATYSDVAPALEGHLNCYVLFPLGPSGPLATSDVLCAQLGLRSQSGAPQNFTLRLNQSATASLTWSAPGSQLGYVLFAVPVDGNPPRTIQLPREARNVTDATGGGFTCYQLYAINTGPDSFTTKTDLVCGLPGASSFPTVTGAAPATAAPTSAESPQVRATAGKEQLDRLLREGQTTVEQEAVKLRRKGR